jgi:hypothetical protein
MRAHVIAFALIAAASICLPGVSGQTPAGEDPDRLYANRADLASARQAAAIWQSILRGEPRNFEAAWKLSRADYWLGGHAPDRERRAFFENGIDAGRIAASIEPNRPEGHFWMAANMGALAESHGLRAGLKYRAAIKNGLETVLRLDPAFQQGSADMALGRWYFKVPRLFGGSKRMAEEHLRASLKYNENSIASRFYLAELLIDDDRTKEAREQLERVFASPLNAEWEAEDQEFKSKATALLAKLNR